MTTTLPGFTVTTTVRVLEPTRAIAEATAFIGRHPDSGRLADDLRPIRQRGRGEAMTVFVVFIPQDYQSAEIVGVYTKRKMAENARDNAKRGDVRPGTTVIINEVALEG